MHRFLLPLLPLALLVPTSDASARQAPRIAFTTSETGTGDLSTWPSAGGLTGLAAADEVCRSLAEEAGLAEPEDFVAWMSDSADDAYCRVHGLSGKRADDCGKASLPVDAGPWVRPDGKPFGRDLGSMLVPQQEVFHPLRIDESGGSAPSLAAFTGTDPAGAAVEGSTCQDWTSTEGNAALGSSTATSGSWYGGGGGPCSSAFRVLTCLQAGAGGALPPFEPLGQRLAFVTSVDGSGDLSSWPDAGGAVGVAAGDAICRARAAAGGLPQAETYKAWLSRNGGPAADRLQNDGPWQRVDRVRVVDEKADLTSRALATPLNVTENGDYLVNFDVRTGTTSEGVPTGEDCREWTSSSEQDQATRGWANNLSFWTDFGERPCDGDARLYCFADVAPSGADCQPSSTALCLGEGGRFRVTIEYETPAGERGAGRVEEIGKRDSGLFTFFDSDNIEMLVKVLNGCGITQRFWVFYAATTNVGFVLTVEDTVTGAARTYENPVGMPALPVLDTEALDVCSPG